MNDEYIIGRTPVLEALKASRSIHKIWVHDGINKRSISQILDFAHEQKITVQTAPKQKLDQFVEGRNHQGVIAQAAAYQYADLDDIFTKISKVNETTFLLILDELEDPHNLGSILRTADAVGVHGVIIPKRRSVGLTSTVAKVSTGAIEHVPVARVTNLSQTIEELKERGLWIVGTDTAMTSESYQQLDGKMPLAIVIGSEGRGISRMIKEKCDFLFHIPMVGHVESLNASVAAGILMYEVFRKRKVL